MADAFTADEMVRIRSYVPWTPPEDDDLNARAVDGLSWPEAAQEAVRRRLSEMLDDPTRSVVRGVLEDTWDKNVEVLERQLRELDAIVAALPSTSGPASVRGLGTVALVRRDRDRPQRTHRRGPYII